MIYSEKVDKCDDDGDGDGNSDGGDEMFSNISNIVTRGTLVTLMSGVEKIERLPVFHRPEPYTPRYVEPRSRCRHSDTERRLLLAANRLCFLELTITKTGAEITTVSIETVQELR